MSTKPPTSSKCVSVSPRVCAWLRPYLPAGWSCGRTEKMVSLVEDGIGSQRDKSDAEAHLSRCPSCRSYRDALRVAGAELRHRPVASMPEGLAERLIQAIEQEESREAERARRAPLLRPRPAMLWTGGALAASACAAAVVLFIAQPAHRSSAPVAHAPIASEPAAPRLVASAPAPHRTSARSTRVPAATPQPETVAAVPTSRAQTYRPAHRATAPPPAIPVSPAELASLPSPTKPHFARHAPPAAPRVGTPTGVEEARLPRSVDRSHLPPASNTGHPAGPSLAPPAPSGPPPTMVASVPESEAVPAPSDASYVSNPQMHLVGALRAIARESQSGTQTASVAVASSVVTHPDFPESVSMVSAPFR